MTKRTAPISPRAALLRRRMKRALRSLSANRLRLPDLPALPRAIDPVQYIRSHPNWLSDMALTEAQRGDPGHLIARLKTLLDRQNTGDGALSQGEIDFIIAALEAKTGKRGRDKLRKVERALIKLQVEGLIDDGFSMKQAVANVINSRRVSRRTVYNALKARSDI